MDFPPLFKKASDGKILFWHIQTDNAYVVTSHGYVGGARQIDQVKAEPKNIDRSNETSAIEQAIFEAKSKLKKQLEKGYTLDPSGIAVMDVHLPMLAQKFTERSKYIQYPCYVQPKLNGMRCISYVKNGARVYQSRLGKFWTTLDHLTPQLACFKDVILDGEIYLHGVDLQDIASLVKNQKDIEVNGLKVSDLEYWVYDIIADIPFRDRHAILGARIFPIQIERVSTYLCGNARAIEGFHKVFIDEGYEGSIIRNAKATYHLNKRSNDLQKYKNTLSDEFEIVGGYEVATGREQGTCIFTCKTREGLTFDVRPKGSLERRKQYWKNIKSLVGKMLTCDFQEWTADKKPFHARGVAIRDYE